MVKPVKKCVAVKFAKIRDVEPSTRIEISVAMARPREQNTPRNIGQESPVGYAHVTAAQKLTKDQVQGRAPT